MALTLQYSRRFLPETVPSTGPVSGGPRTGFFAPILEGRAARLAMEAVMTHTSLTGNGAGTLITIPKEINLDPLYEVLDCIARGPELEE